MEATKLDLFGIPTLEVECKTQGDYWALPRWIVRDGRAYFKHTFDEDYERAFYNLREHCSNDRA